MPNPADLASRLIRNVNDVELRHAALEPKYECSHARHQIINTSSQLLKYLAIGTTDEPEICEYSDSGKYLAEVGVATELPFGVIGRMSDNIDYWEGER